MSGGRSDKPLFICLCQGQKGLSGSDCSLFRCCTKTSAPVLGIAVQTKFRVSSEGLARFLLLSSMCLICRFSSVCIQRAVVLRRVQIKSGKPGFSSIMVLCWQVDDKRRILILGGTAMPRIGVTPSIRPRSQVGVWALRTLRI